jgi:hypothetical protein
MSRAKRAAGHGDLDQVDGRSRMAKAALSRTQVASRATTLAALREDPRGAATVPPQNIPALVAELASEQATLSALQGLLTARLLDAQAAAGRTAGEDRLMTAEEVAKVLGVPKRWVQRRARRLPFARLISEHAVRYSEAGLKRWLEHRRISVA